MTTTEPATTPGKDRLIATHSVLTLNAQHPLTARSIQSAHEMHRTVMSGFYGWTDPNHPLGPRRLMGVLSTWSLDLAHDALVLVVQSRVPPNWESIPNRALTTKPVTIGVDMTLRPGDHYGFRIVYNPKHVKGNAKTPTGRSHRSPHRSPKYAKQWLTDRFQQPGQTRHTDNGTRRIGATADPEQVSVRMLPQLSGTGPKADLKVTRAEAKGVLTVTDPEQLAQTLTEGIGSARAYSCGLLLLRKPGT